MSAHENRSLPKISIITPSYNQGAFIEKTIRSVLNQNYPNLEYIVIDGGSSDASVSNIQKYEAQLSHWESTPDKGQSDAINKGFRRSTGTIIGWLNSDDQYTPGTLDFVSEFFSANPEVNIIAGHSLFLDENGSTVLHKKTQRSDRTELVAFSREYTFHQPSIFWRRSVMDSVGLLDEDLHFVMDYDYWLRMSEHFAITPVDRTLSITLRHKGAKTAGSYRPFHLARIRHVLRRYGNPFTLKNWPLRFSIVVQLATLAWFQFLKKLGFTPSQKPV